MKSLSSYFSLIIIILALSLTGCELVGDIMEFTMWSTLIVVALVVLLILWVVRKLRGPRNKY